jgi:BirA family biotin operon repressor/biotin-[acetyl-CoA-carboxylase] ligase
MLNLRNFFKVREYEKIDSTNDESFRLIKKDIIKEKTVILSDEQTNGRGKKDAIWNSPRGNIYLSFIYPICFNEFQKFNNFKDFSLLIGLSLYEVINFYKNNNYDILIKKPNDILINKKKVAGILIESIDFKVYHYLIVGVGVNWIKSPLENSDYIEKFLKIKKDEFLFHLVMNINEKIDNFQLYYDRLNLI